MTQVEMPTSIPISRPVPSVEAAVSAVEIPQPPASIEPQSFRSSDPSNGRNRFLASSYVRWAMACDFLLAWVFAFLVTQTGLPILARFGWPLLAAVGIAALGALAWVTVFSLVGCYDSRLVGIGPDEFRRIGVGALWSWSLFATAAFLFDFTVTPAVALSCALGLLIASIIGRSLVRQRLYRAREAGRELAKTVVVGADSTDPLAEILASRPVAGFVPVSTLGLPKQDSDVSEWLDALCAELDEHEATVVAVGRSAAADPELMRRLAWRLAGRQIDLMIEPAHGQLTVPRVTFRPAPGLPAFHLDEPSLARASRAVKRVTDIFLALIAVLIFLPVVLAAAVLVRLSGPGPIFYRQVRIGHRGQPFSFWKLRTMVKDADLDHAAVIGTKGTTDIDSYRSDPRITPAGRFLRRWSIDELPQLLNVLKGDMSMVGPRPIMLNEMPLLGCQDHGRHVAKPGITGLWQVSGRKELNWDERIRLDLFYIEKWSIMLDFVIMLRTVKAVLTGHGAQ